MVCFIFIFLCLTALMESKPISTGTTIMAFKYKDGIMLAADSRTSSGVYISSRITNKIEQMGENIMICRSGSAADTQMIKRVVEKEINKLALIENTKPSITKTAQLIGKIIYENNKHLVASVIIAGYENDIPKIFKIHPCGTIEDCKEIAIGGSGSLFIYGFCDAMYQPNMEFNNALDFAKLAVKLAITRDVSSGGVIRIASINKNKIDRFFVPGDQILNK